MKSENLLKVIQNLEKVLPKATILGNLDMSETAVNGSFHKCGTIHCIGGWYAVATMDTEKRLDYIDGAHQMALDLGFGCSRDLVYWAAHNPTIWGNLEGALMFSSNIAWARATATKLPTSLKEIVDYMKGIYRRLLATERPVVVKYVSVPESINVKEFELS